MNRPSTTLALLFVVTALTFPALTPQATAQYATVCYPDSLYLHTDQDSLEVQTFGLPGYEQNESVELSVSYPPDLPGDYFEQPPTAPVAGASGSLENGCVKSKARSPVGGRVGVEFDANEDGMGDAYVDYWSAQFGALLDPVVDLDGDGLLNVHEFRWQTVPVCVGNYQNCRDFELGVNDTGDLWLDGPEVQYWNDTTNDFLLQPAGFALYDPDLSEDFDGDGIPNLGDLDSDNDGVLDGIEAQWSSYPDMLDSDCVLDAVVCTPPAATHRRDPARQGSPGTGDGLNDSAELDAWLGLGPGAALTDFDGDGIVANLLDPDADNDGLLDALEFDVVLAQGQVRPDRNDTDGDALLDGRELAWHTDTDGDGRLNANDPDSDNDGMPDGWESTNGLNMVDPTDASLDSDGDRLSNLREWQVGTLPQDMDTENDLVLDGDEVLVYRTNPRFWDTDGEGMPDRYEIDNQPQPREGGYWSQGRLDPRVADHYSTDPDQDGSGEDMGEFARWPSIQEYTYGRPVGWNEAVQGPWLLGTKANDYDSDDDGAPDGYEVKFGTDPRIRDNFGAGDQDQDGLNITQEFRYGADFRDPDSDDDGLCDGGRALNCTYKGLANQPGELDYGGDPRQTDTDFDGVRDPDEVLKWDPSRSGRDADVDGDGYGGLRDPDSDNDHLKDGQERDWSHTDWALADTDHDDVIDDYDMALVGNSLDPACALDMDCDDDGLWDGQEQNVLHTDWLRPDTDQDGLKDGDEVKLHRTDPLRRDSDADGLDDGWEVTYGTNPLVKDDPLDTDGDGLTSGREKGLGTNPNKADTDGDGMPDGYEVDHQLNPRVADGGADLDSDGLLNSGEYSAGSLPEDADTDDDGLPDGFEVHTATTDPVQVDSDRDGLKDGEELAAWDAGDGDWSLNYDQDPFVNGLTDRDSDNDGLDDHEEIRRTHTKPYAQDSDGDGQSDRDEVMVGGNNPNDDDSDGDGQPDSTDPKSNPLTDSDMDGLSNSDEATYGTDPKKEDSDCDGIKDGAELQYWGSSWNSGGNRLRRSDVDEDGIVDGIEIGAVGTPGEALYRTSPENADTDGDGLADGDEDQNDVTVRCDNGSQASLAVAPAPTVGPTKSLVKPAPASQPVIQTAVKLEPFIQGAYGVRLYPATPTPGSRTVGSPVSPSAMSAQTNTPKTTNPMKSDTDGDGLLDGEEVLTWGTNALDCDSDDDRLGDGLEASALYFYSEHGSAPECDGRDWPVEDSIDSDTDPMNPDSDGDKIPDGLEDGNHNGWTEMLLDEFGYCGGSGAESSPQDGDTDDDGLSDLDEQSGTFNLARPTSLICFDSDGDGLSDGLELGRLLSNRLPDTATRSVTVSGHQIPTWQASATGKQINPLNPDMDGDGVLDGLEDLDLDGRFGTSEGETDPTVGDTDRDGLLDGRELLLYGLTGVVNPIAAALLEWDGDLGRARYTESNPWQTNPLALSSDPDEIPDGSDLNPRADALVALGFNGFRMLTAPDGASDHPGASSDGWDMELYVPDLTVSLPLTNGQYVVGFGDGAAVPVSNTNNYQQLPQSVLSNLVDSDYTPPPGTGVLRRAVMDAPGGVLRFDVPDDVANVNLNGDLTVTFTVHFKDDDGCCSPDDDIDLNEIDKQGKAVHKIKLAEDPRGALNQGGRGVLDAGDQYLAWQNYEVNYMGRESGVERSENGQLTLTASDSVPHYFLDGLQQALNGAPGLPIGSCYADARCVH